MKASEIIAMQNAPGRDEPVIVRKKAIDVLPKIHGIWSSFEGGKPFVNKIELRSWSKDKHDIMFMLSSFNFYFCPPDEEMDVVEVPLHQYDSMEKLMSDDAEFRKKQPMGDAEYARLWAT